MATTRDPSNGTSIVRDAVTAGMHLTVERLDVTDPDSFCFPSGLRLLVSNAFIPGPYAAVEVISTPDWRGVFETNVFGPVSLIRRSIPLLGLLHEPVTRGLG